MKKIILVICVLLMSVGMSAQDVEKKTNDSHIGIGVTVGAPEGLGLSFAVPFTPIIQLRAGYSFLPITYSRVFNFPGARYTFNEGTPYQRVLDFSRVPITAKGLTDGMGKVLLDVFPGKTTAFHFTAGFFVGWNNLIQLKGDLRETFAREDWGTLAVKYNGIVASTDKNGYAHIDGRINNLLPYLGVGFGRAVTDNSRVRFTADLGIAYTGGIQFRIYNYVHSEPTWTVLRSEHLVNRHKEPLDREKYLNRLSDFPLLPMLHLNLYIKIF